MQSAVEGLARNEIVSRVIGRGFGRIRNNRTKQSQHWSIQAYRLNQTLHDTITQWSRYIANQPGSDRYAAVIIHELSSNKKKNTTLDTIVAAMKEPTGSIEIYGENEVHLLSRWTDYAHTIDPEALSATALQEIKTTRS